MILPVILAGGSGERLWPLSRTAYPKQFLSLFDSEHSLFQNTIQRLPANSKFLAPLIVCHEDYRFIVAEQLRQINVRASGIILEPYARNTAPAIATAALWAQQNYPDCTLLILPADHLIADINSLHATVDAAADAVAQNLLVTFGIPAHRPETGYGYIRIGANNRVAQFIEKPDLVTAQKFVNNAEYCWNSGMFFFKPAAYLAELAAPANYPILIASTAALSAAIRDLDFTRLGKPEYANNPSISIDYAVMEKTAHAAVFPLHSAWSDIGNWQAVWEHGNKDAAGNCTYGSVVMHNTSNCLIDARHRLLATLNVQDLVIIETSDALLVANKNSGQEIRQLIAKLKDQTHPALHEHRKVMRPWGWYDCIAVGTGFQVKLISVQPAKSLSLQSHQHRSEHWIVVNGTAKITRGTETLYLQANESTFIPQGVKHQLSNCTANPLEIIEVQSGSYLGEDDIIRYADEHGRAVSAEANV
ncbi:MAG TPA: mannose-1-phosphate guanylyltransferase/mannose-6-phosphate isomerase [Gammaproteobacteria bacterium]|nr:mannose-1-phosphate guanylyltransferase/mannose-6-phosphate isomerase [Gammaproteobacteria bacterium]